ncbi:hypothetical protein CTI12_AA170810 [Artemisia annua]|uniref:Uncharacterized protein n=1 Tax=Artemisia annua TaxID=35608 RepID=A0A2U1PBT8_ARTAN|nr:hypothetical protein CTI12_AA170810 [Artemisia annua]
MEDNDWEAISGSSTTTIHSDEDDVVLVPSVFPPSHHENLPVTPPPLQHHQPVSSSSSSSSLGVDETELPNEQETGTDGEIISRWGVLRSGVLRVLYGIRGNVGVLFLIRPAISYHGHLFLFCCWDDDVVVDSGEWRLVVVGNSSYNL